MTLPSCARKTRTCTISCSGLGAPTGTFQHSRIWASSASLRSMVKASWAPSPFTVVSAGFALGGGATGLGARLSSRASTVSTSNFCWSGAGLRRGRAGLGGAEAFFCSSLGGAALSGSGGAISACGGGGGAAAWGCGGGGGGRGAGVFVGFPGGRARVGPSVGLGQQDGRDRDGFSSYHGASLPA